MVMVMVFTIITAVLFRPTHLVKHDGKLVIRYGIIDQDSRCDALHTGENIKGNKRALFVTPPLFRGPVEHMGQTLEHIMMKQQNP